MAMQSKPAAIQMSDSCRNKDARWNIYRVIAKEFIVRNWRSARQFITWPALRVLPVPRLLV
jgi:hypothetical protein